LDFFSGLLNQKYKPGKIPRYLKIRRLNEYVTAVTGDMPILESIRISAASLVPNPEMEIGMISTKTSIGTRKIINVKGTFIFRAKATK